VRIAACAVAAGNALELLLRESAIVADVQAAEGRLEFSRQRNAAMSVLLRKWEELTTAANKPEDSSERRLARRVSVWLNLNTMTMDEDYRAMVREIRSRP